MRKMVVSVIIGVAVQTLAHQLLGIQGWFEIGVYGITYLTMLLYLPIDDPPLWWQLAYLSGGVRPKYARKAWRECRDIQRQLRKDGTDDWCPYIVSLLVPIDVPAKAILPGNKYFISVRLDVKRWDRQFDYICAGMLYVGPPKGGGKRKRRRVKQKKFALRPGVARI